MTIACFALVLCFPKACGLVPGDDIYAAPPCIVDGAPVFMLHRSPPDSSPNAGAVSVTIDPEVLPTLDSVLHSLDSQFMALCGEVSHYSSCLFHDYFTQYIYYWFQSFLRVFSILPS